MINNQLKFSRFSHSYERNETTCYYNALTMVTVYMPTEEAERIRRYVGALAEDCDRELLAQLRQEGMVIPEEENEEVLLDRIRDEVFHGVSIRVMVLHMTDYCNLRCKYCFIEGGQPQHYKRKVMNASTAHAAVDKFMEIVRRSENETNRPTVVFYGGEPLSNWNCVESTLDYLDTVERENGFRFDKVVITNGTLITPSMVEVLKRYQVMVSVSLDGIEAVHNANRIDYRGEGSFQRAVDGIRILKTGGIEPAVSCVLAQEGIGKCEESIRFLVEELGITGLGFNHVSIIPGLNYYDPVYEEGFARSIIQVQELIQEKFPFVYERRMGHKVNMFIDKQLIRSDCTGCGEQISVSPLGEIGICQGYMGSRKTFSHTVFEADYFPDEDEVFQEWSNRSPLNIEACTHCPALATCGGGCPRNADMLNGSIWQVDTAFCHFAQMAQEWLVWQPIDEG